jgi:hypothetical protein
VSITGAGQLLIHELQVSVQLVSAQALRACWIQLVTENPAPATHPILRLCDDRKHWSYRTSSPGAEIEKQIYRSQEESFLSDPTRDKPPIPVDAEMFKITSQTRLVNAWPSPPVLRASLKSVLVLTMRSRRDSITPYVLEMPESYRLLNTPGYQFPLRGSFGW